MSINIVDEFYDKGFVHLKAVFNKDEINKIKKSSEKIAKMADSIKETSLVEGTSLVVKDGSIMRAVWAGAIDPYLIEIGRDSRILSPVSQILGSKKMDHLINQLHFKRPGDLVDFTWHQDSEHRRYGTEVWKDVNQKGSYVQTVIAIDAMTDNNGPLLVIEDSANEGHLDLLNKPDLVEEIKAKKFLSMNMEPGDLLLFGPYLIHGSTINKSNKQRRVLINGYSYPGANTKVYPGTGSACSIEYI